MTVLSRLFLIRYSRRAIHLRIQIRIQMRRIIMQSSLEGTWAVEDLHHVEYRRHSAVADTRQISASSEAVLCR